MFKTDKSFNAAMNEEKQKFKENIEKYRGLDNYARNEVVPDIHTDSDEGCEDEETMRLLENITDLDPLQGADSNDSESRSKVPKIDPNSPADCAGIFIQIFQTQKLIIANQQKLEKRLLKLEQTFEENAIDKAALMAQNKCLRECKVMVSKVLSGVGRLTSRLDDEAARALGTNHQNDTNSSEPHFPSISLGEDEYQIELAATFPLASIDAIKDFEEKLQHREYINAMATYLLSIKGANGTLDTVFRKIMTDDLIFTFNYDGRNTKRALSKLKLINHVLYGVFSEEGRELFEKAVRKSVDMSHNRMHQKKFQKNKHTPGITVTKAATKKRRRRKSDDDM